MSKFLRFIQLSKSAQKSSKIMPWILAGFSGLLMILAGPGFDFSLLGWFCLVPLIAVTEGKSAKRTFLLGFFMLFVAGLGYAPWAQFLASNYIGIPEPFNYLAPLIMAAELAPVMGFSLLLDKFVRDRLPMVPQIFSFPVFFALLWTYYPVFFFFNFSLSQFPIKSALQPIEFFGAEGLDFILAMANCLVWGFISKFISTVSSDKNSKITSKFELIAGSFIVGGWLVLGTYLYYQWDARISSWPEKKIALIQSNRMYSSALQYSKRPIELEWSEQSALSGAEVAIWPEGLSIGFEKSQEIKASFKQSVQSSGIPIIISDTVRKSKPEGGVESFVSSILVSSDGDLKYYYKNILVPFGEYIPLKLILGPILDWFGIVIFEFSPGQESAVFEVGGMKFVPRICYEAIFSAATGNVIGDDGNGKVLVFQSQDIWYGSRLQVLQHLRLSLMRGVENRLPAIHVINNGVSAVSTPHGEIVQETDYYKGGAWIAEMPFDPSSGGSFYSRNPYFFRILLAEFALLLIVTSAFYRKILPRF